jgi:hypothetical protein
VTSGLAAITLALPLIIAPPWVVLNPPPRLSLSPQALTANCARDLFPEIFIGNIGGGTLTWHLASSTYTDVTLFPTSSGSLPSGGGRFVEVHISPVPPLNVPQEIGLQINSNGGNQSVTFQCVSTG